MASASVLAGTSINCRCGTVSVSSATCCAVERTQAQADKKAAEEKAEMVVRAVCGLCSYTGLYSDACHRLPVIIFKKQPYQPCLKRGVGPCAAMLADPDTPRSAGAHVHEAAPQRAHQPGARAAGRAERGARHQ